jgi:hypothetical protein
MVNLQKSKILRVMSDMKNLHHNYVNDDKEQKLLYLQNNRNDNYLVHVCFLL